MIKTIGCIYVVWPSKQPLNQLGRTSETMKQAEKDSQLLSASMQLRMNRQAPVKWKKIDVECIILIVQVRLMAIYRGMEMCYTHISEFWIIFRRKIFKRIIAYQEFSKLPFWFILSHVRVNAKLFSLMNSNNSTATVRKGCLQATIHCLRHFVSKFCIAF